MQKHKRILERQGIEKARKHGQTDKETINVVAGQNGAGRNVQGKRGYAFYAE